jgi:methyl-accepting chemotaxis protein
MFFGGPLAHHSPANSTTPETPMFANVTVRTRLALLLAFVNLMLFAAAGYAWYAISRLNGHIEHTIKEHHEVELAANLTRKAQVDFKIQVQEWKNTLLRGSDPALYERHWKAFVDRSQKVKAELQALNAEARKVGLPSDIADKAIAEHDELDRRYHAAIKTFKPADPASADDVDKLVRGIDRAATDNIDNLVTRIQEHGDALAATTAKAATSEKGTLVIGLVFLALSAALVSIIAGTLTIIAITRRLQKATEVAREVAAGNLTAQIEVGRNDELGQLLASLGEMNDSLTGIVGRVRQAASLVDSASSEIAMGNADLSSRTEEQASSLEETAASIEEMTATVNQNAQNASQAAGVAISAAEVARKGGVAVDEVVKMMENIQAASKKIADIIGVIDSIAFQTNILALNAAVEAARAGEQGRGFAVVASEVRSLAQRSAEAAKEIKSLITDSVDRVNAGARIADDAGKTMVEVVGSVNRVSKIIGEIASATSEQSTGIAQVNQAVADLDKVTQQNASLVEESTAASESLRELAGEMTQAVSVFRLTDGPQGALPTPKATVKLAAPTQQKMLPKREATARVSSFGKAKTLAPAAGGEDHWKEF